VGNNVVKLSPEQQRVLDYVREHTGVLVRLRGGFWTTPDTEVVSMRMMQGRHSGNYDVPWWSTSFATVRALERKGVLMRCQKHLEPWRDDRRLVEAWR